MNLFNRVCTLAWNQVAMTRLNLGLKLGKCFHVFVVVIKLTIIYSSVLFFEKIIRQVQ